METKKSAKADLEKNKTLNVFMGLALALSVLFVAFEWGGTLKVDNTGSLRDIFSEGEGIDITRPELPTPPPPPQPKIQIPVDFNPIDGEVKGEQPEIEGSESDPKEGVSVYASPTHSVPDEIPDDTDFIIVEDMPEFPGGDSELLKFISKSIKYPSVAQEAGVQGRVVCMFVIDRDGSVVNAEVVRGVDPSLDKEALRVVGMMPKWKPGKQRGKPVRVKYTVPITFKLQK